MIDDFQAFHYQVAMDVLREEQNKDNLVDYVVKTDGVTGRDPILVKPFGRVVFTDKGIDVHPLMSHIMQLIRYTSPVDRRKSRNNIMYVAEWKVVLNKKVISVNELRNKRLDFRDSLYIVSTVPYSMFINGQIKKRGFEKYANLLHKKVVLKARRFRMSNLTFDIQATTMPVPLSAMPLNELKWGGATTFWELPAITIKLKRGKWRKNAPNVIPFSRYWKKR